MLDSIVSCLGLKYFLGDFYLFKAILSKFCVNVNIIIYIFCTGNTGLLLYIVLQNHLLSQGPVSPKYVSKIFVLDLRPQR